MSKKTGLEEALSHLFSIPKNTRDFIELYGADTSIPGADGLTTPLHMAASSRLWHTSNKWLMDRRLQEAGKVFDMLIDRGADIEAKGSDGRTPLIMAVETDNLYTVWLFLERYGASVHATDDFGRTPLLASQAVLDDIPRLLLSKGVDVNARDSDGHDLLDIALEKEFGEESDLTKCLRAFKENPEAAKAEYKPPGPPFDLALGSRRWVAVQSARFKRYMAARNDGTG